MIVFPLTFRGIRKDRKWSNETNIYYYYLKCLFSSKRHFTLCFMEQHCAHTTILVKKDCSVRDRHQKWNLHLPYRKDKKKRRQSDIKKITFQSKIFLWLKTQYSFFLFRDTGYLWAEIHHGRPRPLLALLGPLNPLPLLSPLPRAVPGPDPEVDGYVICPPPLPPRL